MSVFLIFWVFFTASSSPTISSDELSWCPHQGLFRREAQKRFEQRTDRFRRFDQETKAWVELELDSPYELVSCVDDTCTEVAAIASVGRNERDADLGERKRVSLTKMSETSVWVTGESGSIYERFWNGVRWVLAPHDLPLEHAISVYIVNHTILALSESGNLYKMQLSESSQPVWVIFMPLLDQSTEQVLIKSGFVSHEGGKVYFCSKNGTLLELSDNGVDPPRWLNHGQPPGANVAAIADAGLVRTQVIYTISSAGDLYEYDQSSKPLWKKHIWREYEASLKSLKGTTLHGLRGDHSTSLFLLTKDGELVERRLQQRKWKWIVHGKPKDHRMTSVAQVQEHFSNQKLLVSLFLTSSSGSVFECRILKYAGYDEKWINHAHPLNAKAARGVSGLELELGRMIFALDDGRLAELHLPGIGGENSGPGQQANLRRKAAKKHVWTVLESPETEGWNGEYCSEERGPANCIAGTKDEQTSTARSEKTRRKKKSSQQQQDYLLPKVQSSVDNEYTYSDDWLASNFRLRGVQGGRSFFLVSEGGLVLEHLHTENAWIWLSHDHPTAMIRASVGNYNASLFVIDKHGSVLMRERSSKNKLSWVNCTAFRRGKQVISGSPWGGIPGRITRPTVNDSLFFVGKTGKLLRFIVALRKFKWKDCKSPSNTRIACIVDQELFRENVVFVVGKDGRLYQYNKVTQLWHEHYQSHHLVLSPSPGTVMRPFSTTNSLAGSIFMLSLDGGLVEYYWNSMEGWNWVEHGAPHKGVVLESLGPSFHGKQLLLIGSDGNVYVRYVDHLAWKWKNFGFPFKEHDNTNHIPTNCDPKIASVRPIPFAEDSVIFMSRDRRIAELKRTESGNWEWSRIIVTPTSLCMKNHWTALAS